jgi:predicted PurR-regulated permease PerM
VRGILATIGLVLATVVLLAVVVATRQVLTWIVIAVVFAVALYPAVGRLRRWAPWCPRSVATLLVFVVVLLVLAGVVTAFAVPLAQEGNRLAGQLPNLLDQARTGRGTVGELVTRTNALAYVQQNQDRIRSFVTGLTTPAAGVLRGVATGIAGTVTIFVLAYLMVLEGPRAIDGAVGLFPSEGRDRIRRVGSECARSVTGYISGNLFISVICGVLTYGVLKGFGVPFAALIALFVAIADLVPLVGATIGAVVAAAAGFLHSVPAGIAVIVFAVVYQQVENHVLQPLIFSRIVALDPLTVIVAILIAGDLAGVLGTLLAIPVASMIRVIARDVWVHRRGGDDDLPEVAGPDPVTDLEEAAMRATPGERQVLASRPRQGSADGERPSP